MYFKTILTTTFFALLTGTAMAQGQYGVVPNQSLIPDSNNQRPSMIPHSSPISTRHSHTIPNTSSVARSSLVASSLATPTSSGLYSFTPSTFSSSIRPTSSTASSSGGMVGSLVNSKSPKLRAEPSSMDELTRVMPAGEYRQPGSQRASFPTN
ncbi:hypothetical protein N7523_002965 [Penicillium sp. IBT 18751x]|nr:hypothetical protein N7523_002965 [Penicillium sp. IBT 18751x]